MVLPVLREKSNQTLLERHMDMVYDHGFYPTPQFDGAHYYDATKRSQGKETRRYRDIFTFVSQQYESIYKQVWNRHNPDPAKLDIFESNHLHAAPIMPR